MAPASAEVRERIALTAAVLGALCGAIYIIKKGAIHEIAIDVGGLWALLSLWVNPSPFLGKSMTEIFHAARRRELPKRTPIERTLTWGMVAMFAVAFLY